MQQYRIDRSRIVYEVLKSEVIAIDFNTGNYYAITHVAKQVWQLIEQQMPLDQIAQLLANHYKCEMGKVLHDVQHFVEEMLEEGLVELSTETQKAQDLTNPIEMPEGWEYDVPRLQKYSDVQDLLMLDPIHEVTEAGWPVKLD